MRAFAALYAALDASTGSRDKLDALAAYFAGAPADEAAWALHFLSGERLKRSIGPMELRALAVRASGLPAWLFEDCYAQVGDLAETISLVTARSDDEDDADLPTWVARIRALAMLDADARAERVLAWWASLADASRFVLTKLMTGALRVGVARGLVVEAIARHAGLPTAVIAHRLSGDWQPSADAWQALVAPEHGDAQPLDQPYPFYLASPLEPPPDALGARADWLAEWKWDGIRAQLIRRAGTTALWSRGEERLNGRFPEIEQAAAHLPEGVYDGEILGWRDDAPLPFAALQTRINRKNPGPKVRAACPVAFLAYDLIEADGADWRERALAERRAALTERVAAAGSPVIGVSPEVDGEDWAALAQARAGSRARGVEGLMLKRRAGPYAVGRKRGDWWKWKVDPYTLDAVLVYAQPGRGRRANLYTDYTFAVWHDNALVPVAKAYSGLDDREIAALDRWIRAHTTERYGPVRAVEPLQVFELAFEAINASARHKSGVAVRFPRILRWRTDKPADQADSLATLQALAR
jgi:DNA ligase-1